MEALPELYELFGKLQLELYGGEDRTLTENLAGAFTTTGDKCLDFFGTVVRNTSVTTVLQGFLSAWNEDPDKAIRLILNLRDIRGGKGEKKLALVLMYALSCWKPLTYLANLQRFLQVGCYKDLLFIAEMAHRCSSVKPFQRIPQMDSDIAVELKIIACQLRNDERDLSATEKAGISLCAKWAPTENTHFDHKPLRFARKITAALGLKKSEYRKKLTSLRTHLNLLEQLMCTGKWDQIVFKSLPAKAHRLYRTAFHREENKKKIKSDDRVALAKRYTEYLEQLTAGKTTIKSTGTQPHELVQVYLTTSYGGRGAAEVDQTIEGQWRDLISKLAESGNFKHVQAVCDVSGSMRGIPMQVAIALGLVVAELTEAPYKNKLITFAGDPHLHTIEGSTLREKVQNLEVMPWGEYTDLLKVFALLLKTAQENPGTEMVEKLFVFTDMQWGVAQDPLTVCGSGPANGEGWDTTYEQICKMFRKAKFAVPKIIFWNLRATHKSFPVQKDELGTALISGFSAQMLKAFLENDTIEFSPVSIMNEVLDKYEITAVPVQERIPMTKVTELALGEVEKVVEEFLVPKSVPRKRKHSRMITPGADHSEGESSSDDTDDD